MTITDRTAEDATNGVEAVTFHLYKDIHKGIRAELFSVTEQAGRSDPADHVALADLARHVRDAVALLESHATHEDRAIQPAIETHFPEIADQIAADHVRFERDTRRLCERADELAARGARDRQRVHGLYLDLASFTSDYLTHQDLEERDLMPALERAVGVEAVVEMHHVIVSSIPPEQMGRSLAVMLPAMNVDDRADLLGGMQQGAPPEVFSGVWSLVGSVLDPVDVRELARRLGIA